MRKRIGFGFGLNPKPSKTGSWFLQQRYKAGGILPDFIADFENQRYAVNRRAVNFGDIFTFTRSGTGTYVDSDGLVKTASINEARFDYTTGVCRLLREASRTNILTYSHDLASWISNSGGTVTENAAIAPDGTTTADQINMTASNFSGRYLAGIATAAATAYVFSYFIKNVSGGTKIKLGSDDSTAFGTGSAAILRFDTSTKTFSTVGGRIGDRGYEELQNDDYGTYYRVWFVATTTAGDASTSFILFNGDGTGTAAFIVWGAQVEAGSSLSSLIPTNGSSVSRAGESLTITGSAFTDWYDAAKGTLYATYEGNVDTAEQGIVTATDGTVNKQIALRRLSGASKGVIANSGVQYSQDSIGTENDDSLNKIALAYATDNVNHAFNGTAATLDTGASMPDVDRLIVGANFDESGLEISAGYKEIRAYPERVTDAVLGTITT